MPIVKKSRMQVRDRVVSDTIEITFSATLDRKEAQVQSNSFIYDALDNKFHHHLKNALDGATVFLEETGD